ncbi:nuclear transport factor 2 family protein [Haladaptatus sp. DYF46]|uniref:nuclear transport factor 2 family protein n=1 Tax=Haladaptatus sp. DYF46 TaxID=2886041 RepID=UPI001E5DA277|nr:nuclear transport factor 2 family protein [Haladaptatus sp. DYF46]
MNADDAEATVRKYYESLRQGEPLYPYFAEDDSLVKFGISERLVGYEAVAEGLREQTRETEDWTVTSHELRVAERDGYAWFSDTVDMAWTDATNGTRREFDTRWSGTLVERDGWTFVGMHVSVSHEL